MTTSHANPVTFAIDPKYQNEKGIQVAIEYIDNTFNITAGQPVVQLPSIKTDVNKPGLIEIDVNCGRKKSKPVADSFNTYDAGWGFLCNTTFDISYTIKPAELNFYYGLNLIFTKETELDKSDRIALYVAQGSNLLGNNWWIGGPEWALESYSSGGQFITLQYPDKHIVSVSISTRTLFHNNNFSIAP